MNAGRFVGQLQYAVLGIYVVALLVAVRSLVLGVQFAITSSIAGGLAVTLLAVILLSVIGWRISFKWKQLRDRSA